MKHLRKFDSVSDMETAIETAAVDFIGLAYDTQGGGKTPKVNIAKEVNLKAIPFYINVRGAVTLAGTSGLQMSTDGENWTDTAAGDLPTGKTYFRVASDQTSPLKPNWTENGNSDYDIGGNINSLAKTSFENDTTCYSFYNDGTGEGFFSSKTKLKSAGNLILPAMTLVDFCYNVMFSGCSSLTTAPELPATAMAEYCYSWMFQGCTSLTTAPSLPATTMKSSCYSGMFQGCTSLTTAPALPAMTLDYNCYLMMFRGCSSLTTAPALPAMTLASECYYCMFTECTSLVTAPALPATALVSNCYDCMFLGCTSLTRAPELLATTLTGDCYMNMFNGCTKLNYIKCLATDVSIPGCTESWVDGVSSTGTFVKNSSMEEEKGWTTGASGIPEGWTVQDATV